MPSYHPWNYTQDCENFMLSTLHKTGTHRQSLSAFYVQYMEDVHGKGLLLSRKLTWPLVLEQYTTLRRKFETLKHSAKEKTKQ